MKYRVIADAANGLVQRITFQYNSSVTMDGSGTATFHPVYNTADSDPTDPGQNPPDIVSSNPVERPLDPANDITTVSIPRGTYQVTFTDAGSRCIYSYYTPYNG